MHPLVQEGHHIRYLDRIDTIPFLQVKGPHAPGRPEHGVSRAEEGEGGYPEGRCQVGDAGVITDKEGGAAQ